MKAILFLACMLAALSAFPQTPRDTTGGNGNNSEGKAKGMSVSELFAVGEKTYKKANLENYSTFKGHWKGFHFGFMNFANLPDGWEGNDFYTVNGIRTTIYKKSEAENAILKQAGDLYNNAILATATGDDEFEGATKINVVPKAVTYTVDADTKNLTLTKVTFTATEEGGDAATKDYDLSAEQLEAVQNAITVTQYTNAEAYYTVLIKHFGDELTPWNRATKTTAAYPNDQQQADNNWLGRYGVLRNNWYEIEVNGVSAIGSATVPNVNTDTTPDDEVENYISVKINLLSWAKRKQSVTLQ